MAMVSYPFESSPNYRDGKAIVDPNDPGSQYYLKSGQAVAATPAELEARKLSAPDTSSTVPVVEAPAAKTTIPESVGPVKTTEQDLTQAEQSKIEGTPIPEQGNTTDSLPSAAERAAGESEDEELAKMERDNAVQAEATQTDSQKHTPVYTVTPNKLFDYASYTYSISLHMLTPDDYNLLINSPESGYTPKNVLIASAGRHGEALPRHKEFDVDFFFDNLKMDTVIGLNSQAKNSNAIMCSFTVIEPYGCTLLNRLMVAAETADAYNFREMPYLLQIDFFGHTDDGMPRKISDITKYLPIKFAEFKIKLTNKGTEYDITAFPFNHDGFSDSIATTPIKLGVMAHTVGEFFLADTRLDDNTAASQSSADSQTVKDSTDKIKAQDDLIRRMNAADNARDDSEWIALQNQYGQDVRKLKEWKESAVKDREKMVNAPSYVHSYTGAVNAWLQQQTKDGKQKEHNQISFEIDPEISKAVFEDIKALDPKLTVMPSNTAAGSPNANQTGDTTNTYGPDNNQTKGIAINQGTSIVEVIGIALRNSSYIRDQLKDPNSSGKVTVSMSDNSTNAETEDMSKPFRWFKVIPRVRLLKYDKSRNTYAKHVTYRIEPYIVYNYKSDTAPQGGPKGYVKEYNYMFTGQNLDILSLDIKFDSLYYCVKTAATNLNVTSGAEKTVRDGDEKKTSQAITNSEAAESDKPSTGNDALQAPKVVTAGVSGTINMDKSPEEQARLVEKQILTSPSGDMLSITMKILGDPDFIKQDDHFYSSKTMEEHKKNNYRTKNGSIVMDLGEIFVNLTFKTPGDYDQHGLARPGYEKYNSAVFSGIYRVLTVANSFSGGKFEQELTLIRYPNQKTAGVPSNVADSSSDRPDKVAVASTGARTNEDGKPSSPTEAVVETPAMTAPEEAGLTSTQGINASPDIGEVSTTISTVSDADFKTLIDKAPTISIAASTVEDTVNAAKAMATSAVGVVNSAQVAVASGLTAASAAVADTVNSAKNSLQTALNDAASSNTVAVDNNIVDRANSLKNNLPLA